MKVTVWPFHSRRCGFHLKGHPLGLLPILAIVLAYPISAHSQTATASAAMSDSAKLGVTYVFAALGGFIPIRESYRLNYSTKVIGLPMEISGGFMFPVTTEIMVPITARYVRREANFIASTTIGVVSIEPGVRFYLEKERPKDLRIFGAIEGIIAEASVNSIYDVSPNGDVLSQGSASKDYLNIGIGFDLGVVYPLGSSGALDGSVHTSYFPSNTIAHGGLGNIGGVSLTVGYRIGF